MDLINSCLFPLQSISKKRLVFLGPFDHRDDVNYEDESSDRIGIRHLPTISLILTSFGHLIRDLGVVHHYRVHEAQAKQLIALFNDHCLSDLMQLHIFTYNSFIFTGVKKPFEKVECISMESDIMKLSNSNFTFAEFFFVTETVQFGHFQFEIELFRREASASRRAECSRHAW